MAVMLDRLHKTFDPMGAVHKKMFGGVCFMLNGNMVAGTSKRGMLVRTGKDFDAFATGRKEARVMDMGGRTMAGYWFVDNDVDDETYWLWINAALDHNKTLPAK
jgi:TfoX/Sxy family transcriptional regulator of competence genes